MSQDGKSKHDIIEAVFYDDEKVMGVKQIH